MRLRKLAYVGLACVALAASGLGLLLGTHKGRQTLLDTITALTATPAFELKMEGLRLGRTWTLERLEISDAAGPWLEARGLGAQPAFSDLAAGRISILRAEAERIDLARLPRGEGDPQSPDAGLPRLRIQSMDIGQLHIGPGVMGHEARLSLRGGLTLDQAASSAALRVARLDRPKDLLELDARLSLPENTLDLRLDLHEEPRGLLHAALGMNGTQGISVRVEGQGPLERWSGSLKALLSDVARLDGNATLALDAARSAELHALISPGPGWNRFTGLPHEELTVTGRGQWQDAVLRINALDLRSASGTLHGNATWDSTTTVLESTASARADLSWLLPTNIASAPLSASATLRLGPDGIRTQGKVASTDATISGFAVLGAEARFSLFAPTDAAGWQARLRLDAQTPSLPEGLRSWSANATLGQDDTSFYAQNLHVESDRLGLAANGTLDTLARMDARLALRGLDVAGRPLFAILDAQYQGDLDLPASSMNATLDLAAVELDGLPPELAQLLGQNSRLQARFSLSPRRFDLRQALLQARTTASASGRYDLETNAFEAGLRATFPEIGAAALNMAPGATLNAKAAGTPQSFALDLAATAGNIRLETLSLSGVNATARLQGLPTHPDATLRARGLAAREPVSLELRAEPDGKALRLASCVLSAPETTLRFSGVLDPDTLLTQGLADFESTDLRALGRILNTELGGRMDLRAALDARHGKQRATLDGQGRALTVAGLRIDRARLEGSLADPALPGGTDLRAELRGVGTEDIVADSVDARVRGMDAGLGLHLKLSHQSSGTSLSSSATLASDLNRLAIETLRGTLLRQPLALEAPFSITSAASGIAWPRAALNFGPSRLNSRGSLSPTHADIHAELADFDPALLHPLFPNLPSAEVNARLRVTGDPSQPDAQLTATADAIRLENSGLDPLPGLDAEADIRLNRSMLQARASLTSKSEIAVNARFSSPMPIHLSTPVLDENLPVSGQLAGHAKLALLPHFLRLDDQILEGDCTLDFRVAGTWAEPLFTGTARVRDASYENFHSGTVLRDLSLDADADGSTLTAKLGATDGEQGTAQAVGQVDLLTFRHVFDVLFDGFALLRQDLVQSTARGGLRLQGNLERTKLGGSMTLDPTSVRLPAKTPADLAQIEVHEINAAATRRKSPGAASTYPVDLDLRVSVPARLSVKGRGLDSEWSGKLHVGGTRSQPLVAGEMNLLRGKFVFLDRTFDLTKGLVTLSGETPPNPFLEILGETRVLENLIQVRISGPARDFRLTLSSVPDLPQDELLAMILFGRSLRQISPLQAVRLAQAAAEMAGVGAGPDFLDSLKSQLGLQEVDVTKDEDDNTAVGVGGYVGGKYYIRTQSSVSGQDRTKVEIQLTPKISVETEVGADSRQGGGVMWKHDY
ncbi:MAG: translocation/assembly module TamB domain-containing protein [Desulfomicrobium sp.]